MCNDFRMSFNSCIILVDISLNLFKFFCFGSIIFIFFIVSFLEYLDSLLFGLFRLVLVNPGIQGFQVYNYCKCSFK